MRLFCRTFFFLIAFYNIHFRLPLTSLSISSFQIKVLVLLVICLSYPRLFNSSFSLFAAKWAPPFLFFTLLILVSSLFTYSSVLLQSTLIGSVNLLYLYILSAYYCNQLSIAASITSLLNILSINSVFLVAQLFPSVRSILSFFISYSPTQEFFYADSVSSQLYRFSGLATQGLSQLSAFCGVLSGILIFLQFSSLRCNYHIVLIIINITAGILSGGSFFIPLSISIVVIFFVYVHAFLSSGKIAWPKNAIAKFSFAAILVFSSSYFLFANLALQGTILRLYVYFSSFFAFLPSTLLFEIFSPYPGLSAISQAKPTTSGSFLDIYYGQQSWNSISLFPPFNGQALNDGGYLYVVSQLGLIISLFLLIPLLLSIIKLSKSTRFFHLKHFMTLTVPHHLCRVISLYVLVSLVLLNIKDLYFISSPIIGLFTLFSDIFPRYHQPALANEETP